MKVNFNRIIRQMGRRFGAEARLYLMPSSFDAGGKLIAVISPTVQMMFNGQRTAVALKEGYADLGMHEFYKEAIAAIKSGIAECTSRQQLNIRFDGGEENCLYQR